VLVVCLKTAGQVFIDGLLYPLAPGQAMLIFPFQTHRVLGLESEKILWLYMTFELSQEVSGLVEPLRSRPVLVTDQDLAGLSEITEGFLDESQRSLSQSLGLSITLWKLLTALTGRVRKELPETGPTQIRRMTGVVADACRYINQHLHEPIDASDVAKAMGMSEVYLRKLFVRDLMQPPGRHIRETRIIKACELLLTTDAPVSSIARATGFSAGDGFSRTFRKLTGVTPSQYRRKRSKMLP
jgi:AraC-like DNA-binding protein